MTPIPEELLESAKGTYAGFESRLTEVPYQWKDAGLSVTGSFFYLTFRDGIPTVDDFVDYLYWRVVAFCIPRKERKRQLLLYSQTKDERYLHELLDKAKGLFIRARQRAIEKAAVAGEAATFTTGEPGELILFVLLEAVRKAPQIACKMYLKTSVDMPVHGSDGIHIGRGSAPGSVRVIWGESKLYAQLSAALDQICASITSFTAGEAGNTHRDRDVEVLKDHLDIDEPEWRAALLRYFDPYEPESQLREEAFACFVGFDFNAYSQLSTLDRELREAALRSDFLERIATACKLFGDKIRNSGLVQLRIDFFMIPFPSVEELRRKFLLKLGVVP